MIFGTSGSFVHLFYFTRQESRNLLIFTVYLHKLSIIIYGPSRLNVKYVDT